uniref:Uncharacterized protein n=1 Tax=Micrurus surinamensis TaxID=129470 RepID=A0A2D4NNJ2_MICSU
MFSHHADPQPGGALRGAPAAAGHPLAFGGKVRTLLPAHGQTGDGGGRGRAEECRHLPALQNRDGGSATQDLLGPQPLFAGLRHPPQVRAVHPAGQAAGGALSTCASH